MRPCPWYRLIFNFPQPPGHHVSGTGQICLESIRWSHFSMTLAWRKIPDLATSIFTFRIFMLGRLQSFRVVPNVISGYESGNKSGTFKTKAEKRSFYHIIMKFEVSKEKRKHCFQFRNITRDIWRRSIKVASSFATLILLLQISISRSISSSSASHSD